MEEAILPQCVITNTTAIADTEEATFRPTEGICYNKHKFPPQ